MNTDTLSCDMNTLNELRASNDYYGKHVESGPSDEEETVADAEMGKGDHLRQSETRTIQPSESYENYSLEIPNIVFYIIGISFLVFIVILLYRLGVFKHLFKRKKKGSKTKKGKKKDKKKKEKQQKEEEDDIDEEEDLSIDHDDFDDRIQDSQEEENWNKSIRLTYLQTLRNLHETGIVVWQRHKTPTEYAIEACNATFNKMTAIFLRTRYGMFEADQTLYKEMKALSESILQMTANED